MSVLGVLPYWQFGPWELGPLTIHSFGLAVVTGLIWGLWLAGRRMERLKGVHPEEVHNFGIYVIIFGWIVSHIFEVLMYQPHAVRENPLILLQVWGSISSVGGVIGGIIAVFIWMYRHPEKDHLAWANLGAWTLPFCFFWGRVGCALVHDHPGKDATEFGLWNWIYDVTGGAVPEIFPLALEFPDGTIRHDLGFYEMLWWGVLAIIFLILAQKPRREGLFLWLLPLLYAPVRFFLDFLRVEPNPYLHGDARYLGLTPAQYVVIGFFITGIYLFIRHRNAPIEVWEAHKEKEGQEASP